MSLLFALWLAVAPPAADDFYVARLRSGEDLLRIGRPAEAAIDLRIAAFGLLDRPALLCESIAVQALAEDGAGRADSATASLVRLVAIRRDFPSCREAKVPPPWPGELAELARRRLPAASASLSASPVAPAPQRAAPAPAPTALPTAALAPAPTAAAPTPIAPPRPPTAAPPSPTIPLPTATPTLTLTVVPSTPVPSPTPTRLPTAAPTAAAPAVPAETPVPSEELDRQPQIRQTVSPVYPARALAARVGGIVLVHALVSKEGVPVRVELGRGVQPDLDDAAMAAVSRWRFDPGRKGSEPVLAWTTVAVPFDPSRR